MDDKADQIPEWLLSTRNHIPKAKQHWEAIRAEGLAEIKRGLEVTKIASRRLQELDYLEQTFSQELPASIRRDRVIHPTGVSLAGTVGHYEQVGGRIATFYSNTGQSRQHHHAQFWSAVNSITPTAGTIVYMGAEIEKRIESLAPNYQPVFEVIKPAQISSRLKTFNKLGQILDAYDPKYVHMLKGSEEALYHEGTDHLSQAAHSMRDLFQQLIEHLAPSEVVKSQLWFVATSGAPGGVSRMSRLRYMLYGGGENLNEEELHQLDEAAERAKAALDVSIVRAHDHDPQLTRAEVELAIDHARFSLLEVLRRYTQRRGGRRTG